MIALCSVCMLVNVNEVYSVLNMFYHSIDNEKTQLIFIVEILHKMCQITGVLTFSVALFGGLSLTIGFKLFVYQFAVVYLL